MNKIKNNNSIILIEGMYSDSGIIAFILSIAIKFLKPNQEIVCIQTPGTSRISEITTFKKLKTIKYSIFYLTFLTEICNIFIILYYLIVNKFNKIGGYFKHDEIDCSNEFYDTLSIKNGIFWQNKNKIQLYILIVYEYLFFKFVSNFFKKNESRIELLIIGDTAYRYGYFAKISSKYKIPIICNLDLNSIYFNYYPKGYRFKISRPISSDLFDKIKIKYPNYTRQINKYFNDRFSGNIVQHDVLNAYTKDPLNEINLVDEIPKNKIIVSVFSHVFSDAPHNIPDLLFEDFHSWFIDTINSLIRNENVYIIIKEHPSSHLYNIENGLVSKIIDKHFSRLPNLRVITKMSPSKIIEVSDFVVTASGTIIYECLFKNKNLIIASKTSFKNLDILYEFNKKSDYLNFLENLKIIDKKIVDSYNAKLVAFFHFFIYNNRDLYFDFPLKPYVRGSDFNVTKNEFDMILDYVCGESNFSKDLKNTILENHTNFIPKLIFD